MRTRLACILLLIVPAFAASGPKDRQVTDPKSVVSKTNSVAKPVGVEDLFMTRLIFDAAWSPDGKDIVVSTTFTGRVNLWKVAADGSWPVQLSQSDDVQADDHWSPDGRWIAYTKDTGGNELYDIYVISRDGAQQTNLTNTPNVREQSPRWSRDGKSIAYVVKAKESPSYDIGVLDVATHQMRKLTNEKDPQSTWNLVDWSPDGKTVYAVRGDLVGTNSDIYAIDVASANATNLTPHQGKVSHNGNSVSRDGRQVLLSSNEKGGFENIALLDVGSKKLSWVTDTQWECSPGVFSPDGTHFSYAVNEDGRQNVYLGDRNSLQSRRLNLPSGVNGFPGPEHFSPDGKQLLVSHAGANTPNDLWIYDTGSEQARQLTHSALASVSPENLPESQIVHYKTFDAKIISAFLYLPFNAKRDASNPVILYPHGGPTGQTDDNFNRTINALVSRGYIVVAPNPRGSTGYGIDFQNANYQDLGNGDLKDDMAGIQFVLDSGYGDPKKVGVTGGSYGGYTTLMAVGKYPQTFSAAVDLFGPLDWFSMMKNSDPLLQQYIVVLLGDPDKNRQVYQDTSPIKYVANIKAPLLVLQGENDPRVPKEETDQIVDMLKKRGNVVDVHYYPAEGHGFAKRENQIDAIHRTLDWFAKYLPTGTAVQSGQ